MRNVAYSPMNLVEDWKLGRQYALGLTNYFRKVIRMTITSLNIRQQNSIC